MSLAETVPFLPATLAETSTVEAPVAFSWLAHMGSNPQDLVDGILKANDKSWQDAERLARREERVRDDSSCAVDFGSQSTVQMDLVEPADVEVVDASAAAGEAVS